MNQKELLKHKNKKQSIKAIDFSVKQDVNFLKNALRFDPNVERVLYSANTSVEFYDMINDLPNYDVGIKTCDTFFKKHFNLVD